MGGVTAGDDDDHRLAVEVVIWRDDMTATVAFDEAPTLMLRTDDERALSTATEEVKHRTGLTTAILELTNSHLHLELVEPSVAPLSWREPVTPITGSAPWNRQGWFMQTTARIEEALQRAVGASSVGPFRQVKHWSISALIEVNSDVGTFWFKQVPRFMAHESALTTWLSTVRPGAVPDVVADGDDWFLAAAFDRPGEERTLESPYRLLAELQLQAADRVSELLALGCPDRTSARTVTGLRQLAERPDMLEPALAQQLVDALPRLADLVQQLHGSPVPSSLCHGDLHGGNWTRRPDGSWLVFDWTDGCIAHPFFDLGVLPQKDDELREARLGAYLDPWRDAFGDQVVAATLAAALPIAAGFQAISYQRIVDGVGASDSDSWKPAVASYVKRLVETLP